MTDWGPEGVTQLPDTRQRSWDLNSGSENCPKLVWQAPDAPTSASALLWLKHENQLFWGCSSVCLGAEFGSQDGVRHQVCGFLCEAQMQVEDRTLGLGPWVRALELES